MFNSSTCHLYYHVLTQFLFQLDIICILCYVSFWLIINYGYVKPVYSFKPVGIYNISNNNNNCLKSNIQCLEIRVQWTVHLGSSHMHVHAVTRVHAVTPKLVICVMYLTSI